MAEKQMKSLAKDTAIYGVSSILGKFLNWLLVPLYTHVGNGGFSLRKTETFYKITLKERKLIDYFLSKTGSLYHEDIFWGVEIAQQYENFKVPHWEEALAFAFDIRPCQWLPRSRPTSLAQSWQTD